MKVIDNRIKECLHCGNIFEDNTKPGNKKTCSSECAKLVKNEKQRKEYRQHNPPKLNQRQLYYYDHYNYTFWLDEHIGRNQMWKEAVPYSLDKIENIANAQQMTEHYVGKKRSQEAIEYNGDETGSHGVTVEFVEHNREPSEVISYKMTSEEFAEYIEGKK